MLGRLRLCRSWSISIASLLLGALARRRGEQVSVSTADGRISKVLGHILDRIQPSGLPERAASSGPPSPRNLRFLSIPNNTANNVGLAPCVPNEVPPKKLEESPARKGLFCHVA